MPISSEKFAPEYSLLYAAKWSRYRNKGESRTIFYRYPLSLLLSFFIPCLFIQVPLKAQQPSTASLSINGQASLRLTIAHFDQADLHHIFGQSRDWLIDNSSDMRLLAEFETGSCSRIVTHYEAFRASGDQKAMGNRLADLIKNASLNALFGTAERGDNTRLFDLTKALHQGDRSIIQHRIDRLAWTYSADWGTITMGREAVTWGNGLLFNPMDLFNPFSPSDIEREYKTGDDLIFIQTSGQTWDTQFIAVPRRHSQSGNVEMETSSIGLKTHYFGDEIEYDLLAAWHYDEPVAGLGMIGYLGQAAWRADLISIFHDHGESTITGILNLDYSWTWGNKNCYGLLEFFYNSGGYSGNYLKALNNPNLAPRLNRGEVYTLGKRYLAGTCQIELHPLVNFFNTAIVNLDDPSGQFIPRLVWEPRQNLQILIGANFYFGSANTEFGGFELDLSNAKIRARSPHSAQFWAKWYF